MEKDDDFEEITKEYLENMGFIGFGEFMEMCGRHVEEGNAPYTEEQLLKIIRWIEETSINNLLLDMILSGDMDILFDEEKTKHLGENELLFTLTKKKLSEMKAIAKNFLDTDGNEKSILRNFNLFTGGTMQ